MFLFDVEFEFSMKKWTNRQKNDWIIFNIDMVISCQEPHSTNFFCRFKHCKKFNRGYCNSIHFTKDSFYDFLLDSKTLIMNTKDPNIKPRFAQNVECLPLCRHAYVHEDGAGHQTLGAGLHEGFGITCAPHHHEPISQQSSGLLAQRGLHVRLAFLNSLKVQVFHQLEYPTKHLQ